MKLGTFENPFGSFDDSCKSAVKEIMAIAASRENEKIPVSSNDTFELAMWVITYDGLLWQVSQIHDLITDEMQYEVHFVEAVVPNFNGYVEIANDGHMTLCEVEIAEGEDE